MAPCSSICVIPISTRGLLFPAGHPPVRAVISSAARWADPFKKNKLFFFADYQGTYSAPRTWFHQRPTDKMYNGDFSELLDSSAADGRRQSLRPDL